ncbi:MAG: hypothetical protein AAGF23_04800 [Acidobacteriota bacterium]
MVDLTADIHVDVWDQLHSHGSSYPSREDREILVRQAAGDPKAARRLEIWDFFFPLDAEIVTRPERQRLEACLAHGERLVHSAERFEAKHREEVARLRQALEDRTLRVEGDVAQSREDFATAQRRKHSLGTLLSRSLLIFAFGFLTLSLVFGALVDEPGSGLNCGLIVAFFPGLVGFLLARRKKGAIEKGLAAVEEKERENAGNEIAGLERKLIDSEEKARARRERDSYELAETRAQQDLARLKIQKLREQIPTQTTPDTIFRWFEEELAEIRDLVLRESGQLGRLIRTRNANEFCIRGPADLQAPEELDPVYLESADAQKHLAARRIVKLSSGHRVELFGVWAIEFLFLGSDELYSARLFFDFIHGRRTTKSRVHNYNAVALTETRTQFRKIRMLSDGNLQEYVVDNIPSLFFALENGDRIEINFPDESYWNVVSPDAEHDAPRAYDPVAEAKGAIAVLRERVRIARSRSPSNAPA